jgi:hypothetical protein
MTTRWAAAVTGALLIAASVSAFALARHPPVAGTNSVGPLSPQVWITARKPFCQRVSRVPAGADRVRVVVAAMTPKADRMGLTVRGQNGSIAAGNAPRIRPGPLLFRLRPETHAVHPGSVCISNPGHGAVLLLGEMKRPPGSRVRTPAVSLAFLRRGSASWLSETGSIAGRYANAESGAGGGWALVLAIIAAVGGAVLAFWWVVAGAGRRA